MATMGTTEVDSHVLGLLELCAWRYEAERVKRKHKEDPEHGIRLTDTFSEIVTWSWRRRPEAAAGILAGLIGDLRDRVPIADSLIEAVLGGLVLHPVGDGESGQIKADLRPRIVAALGHAI